MRLTKKILLLAVLPLLVIILGALFAPTPPTETALLASVEPIAAVEQHSPDLIATAWERARGLWLAALGGSASC